MNSKVSQKPCPICHKLMFVIGKDCKGNSLTSCSHKFKFKKTKSQKDMNRKYIQMPWGLELAKE